MSSSRPADAGVDTAMPDADHDGDAVVVTQTALFGGLVGGKAASIDVVSNLPDGSMLTSATTDGDGRAMIRVHPGGTVTAIYKHSADLGADLITWVGVAPGDTLTFGSRNPVFQGISPPLGTVHYQWDDIGANHYTMWTSCNTIDAFPSTTGIITVSGTESTACHQDPMATLWAAYDSKNALTSWSQHYDVFMAGGTILAVDWRQPQMAMITFAGLPAEVSSVSGTLRAVMSPGSDFEPSPTYSGAVTGGAFSTKLAATQPALGLVGVVDLSRSEPDFRVMHVLDYVSATFPISQTLATPALPPWAQAPTTTSVASRMASWTVVANASSVSTGQLVHLSWAHTVAGNPNPSQWDVILPPGQTSFTFPTLPPALADSEPAGPDTLTGVTRVFEIPGITGYDQLRTIPSANLMCLECSVRTNDFQRVIYIEM